METNDAENLSRRPAGAVCVAGGKHRRDNRPCQDAAFGSVADPAELFGRAFVVVCDGRGSSEHSQIGAEGAVRAFRKMMRVLEPYMAACLDTARADAEAEWSRMKDVIIAWLLHDIHELADEHKVGLGELEFTLAAAVSGKASVGWLQLGDSYVLYRTTETCVAPCPAYRGEFANQTHFVSCRSDSFSHCKCGIVSAVGVSGLVAFTDGVAEKLIVTASQTPTPGVRKILDRLESGTWDENTLTQYLTDPLWTNGGDDDRGFAYALFPCVTPPALMVSSPQKINDVENVEQAQIPTVPIADTETLPADRPAPTVVTAPPVARNEVAAPKKPNRTRKRKPSQAVQTDLALEGVPEAPRSTRKKKRQSKRRTTGRKKVK